jgi:hypothetical protein
MGAMLDRRLGTISVLVALAAITVLLRWRYFDEPLENDITVRISYGLLLLQGELGETFSFGPPMGIWINAAFVWAFGPTEFAVFAMGCTFAIATMLGVHRAALKLAGPLPALAAAATFVPLAHGLLSEANQPNAEVFINAFSVWAVALLADARAGRWQLIGAGFLAFCATAVKHSMLGLPLMWLLLALALAALPEQRDEGGLNEDLPRRSVIVLGVVAVSWLALLIGYAIAGRLGAFWHGLLGHSLSYAATEGGVVQNLLSGLLPYKLMPADERRFAPLFVVLAFAIVVSIRRGRYTVAAILAGWAVGVWACISVTGRSYAHYYTLWYPVLAVAIGVAVGWVTGALGSNQPVMKAGIAMVAPLYTFAVLVPDWMSWGPAEAVVAKYQQMGRVLTEVQIVGRKIRREAPDTRAFELGANGLYLYARLPPPSPFVDSLYGKPDQFGAHYVRAMEKTLLEKPPEILVVSRALVRSESDDPRSSLLRTLLSSYQYVPVSAWSSTHVLAYRRAYGERAVSAPLENR